VRRRIMIPYKKAADLLSVGFQQQAHRAN
jgi:hypothetical protein